MTLATMHVIRRNLNFGWWSLLCWLALGMALEAMHGFKVGWYLDVTNDARRLQLSLAHTHGTLIALVNLAFYSVFRGSDVAPERLSRSATCLRWAGMLMPTGFLLGGIFAMGADPGFAVALVPIGGLLLFAGVLFAARAATALTDEVTVPGDDASPRPSPRPSPPPKPGKKPKR